MRLIVQKYGGTSVGSAERIRNVAKRIVETQREDCRVVAIISAMAGVTDELIKLAHEMSPDPDKRELDVLLATGENAATALTAMAVNALGVRAISLTGAEAGVLTNRIHTKARIANIGSKVMQSRAVEFAKKFGVEFEVRSSLKRDVGTLAKEETANMEDVVVRGVSIDRNQAKVTVDDVRDEPGVAGRVFSTIAAANIVVDMIVQSVSEHGTTDLSFTIHENDLDAARKLLEPVIKEVKAAGLITKKGVAKLSVVGIGMRSHSGVAARLFDCLGKAGINIQLISTSEIKIAVVIDEAAVERAAQLTHAEFGLAAFAPAPATMHPLG